LLVIERISTDTITAIASHERMFFVCHPGHDIEKSWPDPIDEHLWHCLSQGVHVTPLIFVLDQPPQRSELAVTLGNLLNESLLLTGI
jgi:hypothetical protein